MLEKLVEELRQQNVLQAETIVQQQAEIATLKARIEELLIQVGKNSGNSSKPPSSDGYQKVNRAARRREGRERNKQKDTKGYFLKQVDEPDEIITHVPTSCRSCGEDLTDVPETSYEKRQLFEIPVPKPVVTEHRAEKRCCPSCGAHTTAEFPDNVDAPAVYGPRVRAAVVYYAVQQHIPYQRTAMVLHDLHGLPLSEGTIATMLKQAGAAAAPFCDAVREQLVVAKTVHFDETGARVGAKLHWVHSASTSKLTLIDCYEKRGTPAMESMDVLPRMEGVAVHDGWKPYRSYDVPHGLCNAHHLRELDGIAEGKGQKWAEELADLLCDANEKVKDFSGKLPFWRLNRLRSRYRKLLAAGYRANPPPHKGKRTGYNKDAFNLLQRLEAYETDVLRFCSDPDVPFDNNQAERDIRMVKLQQKISGCWRTLDGAKKYCAIRSYISTLRKNDHNILAGLEDLFQNRAWMPLT